ncbi:ATP-binding cassette domain-containing protein [Undibacterium sp. Di24W]|uniref:ABC transporter ATP-binding protein n=1 Tax=Undibacterium sp. Di24W TaxID=3413033 RepID=UPI003BF1F63D
MIIVEDLHKEFIKLGKPKFGIGARSSEKVKAVNGVSFTAQDGAILGLLGANGAGKTTSLRMVASMLKMDSGSIKIDNVQVKEGQTASQARLGILSDARGLYPRLTARENIQYYGKLHGMDKSTIEKRTDQLAHWLEIHNLLERRTEGFSQGERMKIALARALIHDPKNIILDEPTNGLDVVATRALREFLRWLRTPEGGGKCIVFSTHIMQEVERLCDTVVIVAQGRTVSSGTVSELMLQANENDFEDAFVKLAFLDKQSSTNSEVVTAAAKLKQGSLA